MDLRGWNVIDAERAVLWREYEFSKGAYATTLVFRGADGLVVVSPCSGLERADYEVLSRFGEVRALVANNAIHHLGQRAWREAFPAAESFASAEALPRLGRKAKGIPFRAIEELPVPDDVRCHPLPGCKNGELLLSVGTTRGALWFTGDLLTNIQRTPGPPLRWLFSWTDSAPGFRLFKLAVWLFVHDKPALKQRLTTLLAQDPPALVVPGHGPPIVTTDVAEQTERQIAKL